MRRRRPQPLVSSPSVSVVIPCYNYGRFLPDAVDSALSQAGVDVDVLIVDDASTDGSEQVASELAAGDARVHVLRHPENMGHIQTYNDGLARATGKYVVLLSADDLLAPGALSRSAALMEACPEVALVYGYPVEFAESPPLLLRRSTESWTTWRGVDWIERICARGRNTIMNPEAMLRTSIMQDLVGYGVDHPHAADLELWLRAAVRGNVGRVNGPPQAYYRIHPGNMHSTRFAGLLTDMEAVRRVFDDFFLGDGRHLPEGSRLHDRAMRSIAREALRVACLLLDTGKSEGSEPAELSQFALEIWPRASGSRAWVAYERRTCGAIGVLRRRAFARCDSLRWAVRWRRWQRFGT